MSKCMWNYIVNKHTVKPEYVFLYILKVVSVCFNNSFARCTWFYSLFLGPITITWPGCVYNVEIKKIHWMRKFPKIVTGTVVFERSSSVIVAYMV